MTNSVRTSENPLAYLHTFSTPGYTMTPAHTPSASEHRQLATKVSHNESNRRFYEGNESVCEKRASLSIYRVSNGFESPNGLPREADLITGLKPPPILSAFREKP